MLTTACCLVVGLGLEVSKSISMLQNSKQSRCAVVD